MRPYLILALIAILSLISLASAEYVYIIANPNDRVILETPDTNTYFIFDKNFTFYNMVVTNTSIILNSTTIIVNGTNTTNVTFITFNDVEGKDRWFSFKVYSADPENIVSFNISGNFPGVKYAVYRNDTLYDVVKVNVGGWLNYTYKGGFSTWVVTFQPYVGESPAKQPIPRTTPIIPIAPIPQTTLIDELLKPPVVYYIIAGLVVLLTVVAVRTKSK